MNKSRTVTVDLDVHARAIRLAAVRAHELLEERTLPYGEERWSAAAAPLGGSALLLLIRNTNDRHPAALPQAREGLRRRAVRAVVEEGLSQSEAARALG